MNINICNSLFISCWHRRMYCHFWNS